MPEPGAPGGQNGLWTRARREIGRRFEVDTRALAVLRVGLGVLILVDLFYRSMDITAFYTDHGVYPRSFLSWARPVTHNFVLHAVSGETWFIAVLFIVQALFALALIVGFRTRIVTIISFLLLLSLHTRNTYILNAGDTLLRLLLFWAIFLPLGERWSLDTMRHPQKSSRVGDFATAAILVQVVIVYVLNAYHKTQSGAWVSGEALQYVFHIDRFMTPLGQTLTAFPDLLLALTKTWYYMVLVSPLLLLLTGWARTLLAALFAGAHLSMFVLMQIGVFPLVSVVALLPFLHERLWDLLERRIARPLLQARLKIPLLKGASWVQTPHTDQGHPPQKDPFLQKIHRLTWIPHVRSTLLFLLLAWLIGSTGITAGLMTLPDDDVQREFDRREKRWSMFANPGSADQWIVAPAQLESGRQIDALHLDDKQWSEPRYIDSTYPDFRWRKYLDALARTNRDAMLTEFGDYLCGRWNDDNDDKMEHLVVYRVTQKIDLEGDDPEPVRNVLGRHECYD